MKDRTWAMLAMPYEQVDVIHWNYIGQPKLDGIRCKWDGEHLTSRQGERWNASALPHIFAKLKSFSAKFPGVVLDGELYAHGIPFQEIEARCAVKRLQPHINAHQIDFHAFDIISHEDTESRQLTLSQIYAPWVAICRVTSQAEATAWLNTFIEHGYEGMMLRAMGCPYIPNRTEALIKLKPVHYDRVTVLGTVEGKGKFQSMLGAFNVELNGVKFDVGGGSITESQRIAVWMTRETWPGRKIMISYRDKFKSGRPVQPQIHNIGKL